MEQMTIFDFIPDKQVLITYRDRYGVTHQDKVPIYDTYKKAVLEWREAHKDFYFIGTEEV